MLTLLTFFACSSPAPTAPRPKPVAPQTHTAPTYKGRYVDVGVYPPLGAGGDVTDRVNWLVKRPFDGTMRLKRAIDEGSVRVVLDPSTTGASFRAANEAELREGTQPYIVSIGARSLQDESLWLDLMAAVSHEGVHVGQCLDHGRCPATDLLHPETACATKWTREFEGYRESCYVIMATGPTPPMDCTDGSAIATLTYNVMVSTGQVAGLPMCESLWRSKNGP